MVSFVDCFLCFPFFLQQLKNINCLTVGVFWSTVTKKDCENDNVVLYIFYLVLTSISKLLSWEDKGCLPNCRQHKSLLYSDSSLSLTSTSISILWETSVFPGSNQVQFILCSVIKACFCEKSKPIPQQRRINYYAIFNLQRTFQQCEPFETCYSFAFLSQ